MAYKAFLRDHTRRIKYYLLAVIFSTSVLQFNVSALYLKTKQWSYQLTKQVGAAYDENSAEIHEQTHHIQPYAFILMATHTNAVGRKQVHISEAKHFQSAKYRQYLRTNINSATRKSSDLHMFICLHFKE